MKIAVIGWGSPVWDVGSLKLASEWHPDGPTLPLEFSRISGGRRLTMVLHPGGSSAQTLWALSAHDELTPAMKDLRQREKTVPARIHFATDGEATKKDADADVISAVREWMAAHPDLDAAIWLATEPNFLKRRQVEFSSAEAKRYLADLEQEGLHENARDHLRRVPEQCRTELWSALMKDRDW